MELLHLSLLGPFQALAGEQAVTAFPTDKVRALLAFLAVEAGAPHRRETLAALLWPDWPEDGARRNLRQSLHRLRQTLDRAQPGLGDRLLAGDSATISARPEALRLDVAEFRRLLAEVEGHRHRSLATCRPCLERLAEALDLYRGELLAGFSLPDAHPFEEWQTLQREALHHQALAALDALAGALEQSRDYSRALALTMRQLALDPWNEAAHRRAMRSLALTGQRGDALAHYDATRRLLAEELGDEPSPETRALYWQIASGELVEAGDGARVVLHGCPAQFTRFIGRQRELNELLGLLSDADSRLVTVVGPGGIGKTRLAVEAAQAATAMAADFPDGVFFVSLEDVRTPDLLAPVLANSLGLAVEAEDPRDQIVAFLRPRRLLLILDNFEHHLTAAGLVLDILRAAPGVQVLVTSQLPLELRAERRLSLEGLSFPHDGEDGQPAAEYDAVQLFIQAAQRTQPGFDPDSAGQQAIAGICSLVQGMPLAIELAAAWIRLADCQTIAGEIARNLDFLSTRLSDVPARHRSMRAVFDYAWRLLNPPEQALLARTSVFRASFSLDAASAVCDAGVADLTALLDRSLLGRAADGRLAVHPLLRQFAADLLEQTGGAGLARSRHMQYYARLAAERGASLRCGADQLRALAEFDLDLENILAAWDQAVAEQDETALAAMLDGLFDFWTIRSRFREGELHLRDGVQRLAARGASADLLASVEARLAWFVFHGGRVEEARRMLERSLETLHSLGNPDVVFCHAYLGALQRHAADYSAAHDTLAEGLRLARRAGDDYFVGVILNLLGQVASLRGDFTAARAALMEALAVKQRIGDRWGMTFSYSYLGRVALGEGSHDEARELLRQSLLLSQEFGDRRGIAFALFNLGQSALVLGETGEAAELLRQSLHMYEEIGSRGDTERVRGRLVALQSQPRT